VFGYWVGVVPHFLFISWRRTKGGLRSLARGTSASLSLISCAFFPPRAKCTCPGLGGSKPVLYSSCSLVSQPRARRCARQDLVGLLEPGSCSPMPLPPPRAVPAVAACPSHSCSGCCSSPLPHLHRLMLLAYGPMARTEFDAPNGSTPSTRFHGIG
jgi:hypothetical protein